QHLFEVDALNRVTKQADGTSSTPPSLGSPRYTWTLDAAGNWDTTNQDTPGSTQSRTANAQNEYTAITSQTVSHDWRGNTAQHGDRKYEYDWDNRLIVVRDGSDVLVSKYAYDALGRLNCRLKHDEQGDPLPYEFLHYAGRGLVLTYTQGGAAQWFMTSPRTGYLVGMWVDGPDEGTDPEFHAALHNSRGDVSALTQNGVVSESYHYSTYGRRTVFNGSGTTAAHDSPLGNVIGLTGQISLGDNSGINCDPESYFSSGTPRAGLWHMNARTYSPSLGRFVQRDPSGFADGANLYAYAGSNPWVYVDPEGLAARATWNATVSTAQTVGSAAKQAAVYTDHRLGQATAWTLGANVGYDDASFVSLAGAAGQGAGRGAVVELDQLTWGQTSLHESAL
ncbi:MAG: RHS repeat-associated core domain-containing protein, partial [Chloroflexi bacterium]|nr:RHS repeat-associated core domain-containing protein [Chloroflexota bacterium]